MPLDERWPMIEDVEEVRLRRGMIGLGLFGPIVYVLLLSIGYYLDEEDAFLIAGACLSLLMYGALGASVIGMPIYLGTRWKDPGPKDRVVITLFAINLCITTWIGYIMVQGARRLLD